MNFDVSITNISKLNNFNSKICGINKNMKKNIQKKAIQTIE